MSAAEYTPGPWQAVSSGPGLPLIRIQASIGPEAGGGYSAHCIALMSVSLAVHPTDEHVNANARLIAQAPDLLAALRAIERITLSKGLTETERKTAMRDIGETAHAAIERATGAGHG